MTALIVAAGVAVWLVVAGWIGSRIGRAIALRDVELDERHANNTCNAPVD